ncbi:neutral/alkaline non-lysosomal ceramidase N-terminal domain-containing protein [Candidatus Latescibacterota bacterium]
MSPSGCRAGTAKAEITPPLTIPYLGFVPRQAPFEGIHDALHARALVADDGDRQVAVVTADAIGFSDRILGPGRSFRQEFRRQVSQRSGLDPEAVMLAASHAHSTPETLDITPLHEVDGAVSWAEGLAAQLAELVAEARSRLQPARLKAGSGRAEGIAANRRQLLRDGSFWQPAHGDPSGPVVRTGQTDEEVGVLLVELEDGTCSALVNFTCHPVSVQVQPLVSADYPGAACSLVEDVIPELQHCLFTQGACGNINPRGGGMHRSFADVSRYGHLLGSAVIGVVERLRVPEVGAMSPTVGAATVNMELPVRDLPPPQPYREARDRARARVEAVGDGEGAFEAANALRSAEETLRTVEMEDAPLATVSQAIRLGEVCLAGCPGEPFVELGLEIKAQSPAPRTFVVGYANDYAGYLSTPAAFAEGGYETSLGPWCRVAPEGGRQCVDAVLGLARTLFIDDGQ